MKKKYRPNVAAILQNSQGEILVAERCDIAGAWQFPQGGVDEGEGVSETLYREVEEELGLTPDCYTIKEHKSGYRYDFPGGRLKHGIYSGQEQDYFLCAFSGKDSDINLETEHPEFSNFRWIQPKDFDLSTVPEFKKSVFRDVFRDFFGVLLE